MASQLPVAPDFPSDDYLAGFFDAEGSASRTKWGIRYQVTNTEEIGIAAFVRRFGGKIYSYKHRNPLHKPYFQWYCPVGCRSDFEANVLARCYIKRLHLGFAIDDFKLTPEYLAGFIDGDGTITVNKAYKEAQTYRAVISAHNKCLNMLRLVKSELRGGIIPSRKHGDATCRWSTSAGNAETVITMMLPYLILKRQQAILTLKVRELGREFITFRNGKRTGKTKAMMDNKLREVGAAMRDIKQQITALNQQPARKAA